MTTQKFFKGIASASLLAGLMLPFAAGAALDVGLSYGSATGLTSTDIRITIAKIIKTAMSLLGIVAVLIVLYGGFKWMTAGGNEDQVGEAKKILIAGIIGLIIIMTSYAIATFVVSNLVTQTT